MLHSEASLTDMGAAVDQNSWTPLFRFGNSIVKLLLTTCGRSMFVLPHEYVCDCGGYKFPGMYNRD